MIVTSSHHQIKDLEGASNFSFMLLLHSLCSGSVLRNFRFLLHPPDSVPSSSRRSRVTEVLMSHPIARMLLSEESVNSGLPLPT